MPCIPCLRTIYCTFRAADAIMAYAFLESWFVGSCGHSVDQCRMGSPTSHVYGLWFVGSWGRDSLVYGVMAQMFLSTWIMGSFSHGPCV